MVLAGMDTHNFYEKYFFRQPPFYIWHKDRVVADFFDFGDFSKDCLEA
jgi:hypothetical protein